MKKLLLLISVVLSSITTIKAQNFELYNNDDGSLLGSNAVVSTTLNAGDQSHLYFSIKNISSNTVTYGLYKTHITINGADDAYFCFGGQCYPSTTFTSPTTVTVAAGQFNSSPNNIQIYLDEDANNAGYSEVKYTVYDINNPSDNASFTIKYNETLQSVKENSNILSLVSDVYPNPAVNKAQISFTSKTSSQNASVTLINSLGSVVSVKKLSVNAGKNNVEIDADNLSTGIYFATISVNNIKTTKKFTTNK